MLRLRQQLALATRQVREEGAALKIADARTLKPINDVDVAAAKAAKIMEVDNG